MSQGNCCSLSEAIWGSISYIDWMHRLEPNLKYSQISEL